MQYTYTGLNKPDRGDPVRISALNDNFDRVTVSNKNLLLNWDFRNPVNQRGQSVYDGSVYNSRYTVDRWKYWSQNICGKVEVLPTSIKIGSGIGHMEVHQTIDTELMDKMRGKQVTLSVDVENNADINLYLYNTTLGMASIYSTHTKGGGIVSCTGVVPQDAPSTWLFVISTMDSEFILHGAKLELGFISTLANDPPANYREQLTLCQRYFQRYKSWGTHDIFSQGAFANSHDFVGIINLSSVLHRVPTITYAGNIVATSWTGAGGKINGLYPLSFVGNALTIVASTDLDIPIGSSGTLRAWEDTTAYIDLDAEIY